ncbi:MAG TPA: hypothetical protein DDY91_10015 [Planctomycetaceae bacterium]|nr:hypothetical protein [Planctomycetaceae bacterium]
MGRNVLIPTPRTQTPAQLCNWIMQVAWLECQVFEGRLDGGAVVDPGVGIQAVPRWKLRNCDHESVRLRLSSDIDSKIRTSEHSRPSSRRRLPAKKFPVDIQPLRRDLSPTREGVRKPDEGQFG